MSAIEMPALSFWQPYASLIFVANEGLRKLHETRGDKLPEWRKGVRHLIHATLKPMRPKDIPGPLHRLCVEAFGWDYRESLPRGCAIGTVIFADSVPIGERQPATEADRAAGIWSEGRFAWLLAEPELLPQPVPMAGRQNFFTASLPA